VAAFIAESVSGATLGAVVPPEGYWPAVREICDRYGVLLIADEVMTGFGRTGRWFGMEHLGAQPDVMTMGKGATGGYFPLSIIEVRAADVETIHQAHGNFIHGGTFSHHVVGAATAVATLDYLEKHDLVTRANARGAYLGQRLREVLEKVGCVGDVRGVLAENVIRPMIMVIERVSRHNRALKTPFRKVNYELGSTSSLP
jgi:adenosylmethionine-8-amino-7-oxononanoate aminotransferase